MGAEALEGAVEATVEGLGAEAPVGEVGAAATELEMPEAAVVEAAMAEAATV